MGNITSKKVISLLVRDPRLMMPKKKSFNKTNIQDNKLAEISTSMKCLLYCIYNKIFQLYLYFNTKLDLNIEINNTLLSKSTIWDQDQIKNLNKNKLKTYEINKIRSNYMIPTTKLHEIEDRSKIPILLIKNDVNEKVIGWDLILPKTWAMDFWMPLVHYGAKAIAQKELSYLMFETGKILNN